MGRLAIHKVNFFHPEAKAIHCISYDKPSLRLAVARSDSSIEIWDVKGKPFVQKILSDEQNSVEAIAWYDGRLFSAGLHSCIVEYDLQSVTGKTVAHTGQGIWCLEVNKSTSMIAAGTEDGCICIYKVQKHGIDLEKTLGKQEGRILCLAWHESGDFIATGSIDTIRIWDVHRDQVCERITIGRTEERIETIVWCIAMTKDFTIISGDSSGRTSFWNGNTGTLFRSVLTHKGDVLALCLSECEREVSTAGIDPIIVKHERLIVKSEEESKDKWMKSLERKVHTHDVRALTVSGRFTFSGGVDTYLVCSKFPPKTVTQYSPFSQLSYSSVASEKKLLLLRYPKQLELWKFKESTLSLDEQSLVADDDDVKKDAPIKLLSLKSKHDETIICSAISSDGRLICFSTILETRLFYVTQEEGEDGHAASVSVKKVPLPETFASSTCLTFISSSRLVISSKCSFSILTFENQSVKLEKTFCTSPCDVSRVCLLVVSPCATYMACGSENGTVLVHNLENTEMYETLPKHEYHPTAISFDQTSTNLVVVYSDRKVVHYNLKSKIAKDCWSNKGIKQIRYYNEYPIRGVIFPSKEESFVIFYDEFNVYIVEDLFDPGPEKEEMKKVCEERSVGKLRFVKNYKYLLGFHQFFDGEMLAVEVKPSVIRDNLPAPLRKKHYGT